MRTKARSASVRRARLSVADLVCGNMSFDMSNPATHPDMTIRRPDGSWIFHFVNVVDDLEMKITHVIRGEDHLSNTPKHIELYRALGAEPPSFAHIPLILNHEGKKLSKRDGGSSIDYFVENGYAPEAVLNYLCLLGWSPKDNREMLSLEEIRGLFELQSINRRNAIFDLDKCFWLNGQYILQMSLERFYELSVPFVEKAGIAYESREDLLRALAIVKPKVKHLSDVPTWIGFLFTDDYPFEAESVEKTLEKPGALEHLKSLGEALDRLRGLVARRYRVEVEGDRRGFGPQARGSRASGARRRQRQIRRSRSLRNARNSRKERVLARFARAASLIDQRPE